MGEAPMLRRLVLDAGGVFATMWRGLLRGGGAMMLIRDDVPSRPSGEGAAVVPPRNTALATSTTLRVNVFGVIEALSWI